MYKVLINGRNLTNFVGSLSWSDDIETLGTELSFTLATSRRDRRFASTWDYSLGDKVELVGPNGSLLYGVITDEDIGEKVTNFVAYDMAWYLNKSTMLIQFKKMIGNECVKSLCEKVGIEAEVTGLDALIDTIYKDMTVADIIRDIIEKCSKHSPKRFFLEFSDGKLVVKPFEKIEVTGRYEVKPGYYWDVGVNAGDISYSRSIQDLKNSVLVVSGDKEAVRVEGIAEDPVSIEAYGKVQEVIELDEQDYGKANLVAKNELKKLNKVAEDISLRVLGDDQVRSGRVISLDIPQYGLEGDFLIKSSTHSIDNGIHTADLVLEVYEDGQ